ncbi:MAG: GNAT family N-acetyltransferase [Phycisphaerae bacterium]|nr:GNAT family N-acetyltransferase [Phycisphaerae bacterium]
MLNALTMPVSELADRLAADLSQPAHRPMRFAQQEEWERLERFLRCARAEGFDLSDAAAVVDGGSRQVHWACLAVRSAGRTSLLILAPLPGEPAAADPLRAALRLLVDGEAARGMGLIQGLLAPTQSAEARLLLGCGFDRLAELIYMQAELPAALLAEPEPRDGWPELPGDREETFRDEREAEFSRVIQASYVHTLDCPGLEGVRRMEDVLTGHKASGIFRPDLWFLFSRAGRSIGAVLLNEILDSEHTSVELVYMGLVESARGQGLGRRIFHHAMRAARRAGFVRIVTAVDAANQPAVKLYRSMGFEETLRRVAYILPAGKAKR